MTAIIGIDCIIRACLYDIIVNWFRMTTVLNKGIISLTFFSSFTGKTITEVFQMTIGLYQELRTLSDTWEYVLSDSDGSLLSSDMPVCRAHVNILAMMRAKKVAWCIKLRHHLTLSHYFALDTFKSHGPVLSRCLH